MDCTYAYLMRSSSSGTSRRTASPSRRRTGTGAASATPVPTSTNNASATAALRSPLPRTLVLVIADRAGVVVDGRAFDGRLELQVLRLRVDGLELRAAVEQRLEDRVGERFVEVIGDDEQVRRAGDLDVCLVLVRALRDRPDEVVRAVRRRHLGDGVRVREEVHLHVRRVHEVGDGRGREA